MAMVPLAPFPPQLMPVPSSVSGVSTIPPASKRTSAGILPAMGSRSGPIGGQASSSHQEGLPLR